MPEKAPGRRSSANLGDYRERFGDCDVPTRWSENPELSSWVGNQRALSNKNKLPERRKTSLDGLGFTWDAHEAEWKMMFAELQEYEKQNGDCNVPRDWPENRSLGNWVINQRARLKRGVLSLDRKLRLDAVGFLWDRRGAFWSEMFGELRRYKDKYRDCDVPRAWPENPKLALWVGNQRGLFRKHALPEDRKACLDEIDFVWHTRKHNWEHMFAELRRYKETYRNCNVPLDWPDNPKLSKWVREQRAKRRSISAARRAKLGDLEFVWAPYDAIWDEMFQQLQSYREKHGDCNVPLRWSQNPKLSHWVANQRQFHRRGKLEPHRIKRLKALGFEWSLRNRS